MVKEVNYYPYVSLNHTSGRELDAIKLNDWYYAHQTVCDLSEIYSFAYGSESGVAVNSRYEFGITIVCKDNTTYANTIIGRLLAAASASDYGMLEVISERQDGSTITTDRWILKARCIGLEGSPYHKNGTYKFKAKFEAPDFNWSRKYGTYNAQRVNNSVKFVKEGTTTQLDYIPLPEGRWAVDIKAKFTNGGLKLGIGESIPVAQRKDSPWYNLYVFWADNETAYFQTDYWKKLMYKLYDDTSHRVGDVSAMGHADDATDPFFISPYCHAAEIIFAEGSFTILSLDVYQIGALPQWL